ncbi:MAG: hypothetical protein GY913_06055 [Proteobacteria bacterium]|nr:hypothetical protein [Pseudomonadota bacterium]MCP4916469.1 hypothetical protein [Pseudomonadota bacterium]
MRPFVLWLIALAVHAAWATTLTTPVDWDPAYYATVAQHMLAGDGVVTGSLVFLGSVPEALPMAADQHWSPLPSRVLLPGLAVWPEHGDQLVTVVLAAAWAPLAWALAKAAKLDERTALLAGLMGATGGGYARMISTPDSIALAGVLGGLAMWYVLRERWVGLAIALSALVLTRGDGLVAAAAIALIARDRRALPALGLAIGTWLAWRWLHPGATGLYTATHYAEWVLGHEPSGSRLGATGLAFRDAGIAYFLAGAAIWPVCALGGAWDRRPLGALFVGTAGALVVAACVLAPALAESGTLYRSGAILAPAGFALAAAGISRVSEWAVDARGYPVWLLPVLLGGGGIVTSLGLGAQNARLVPSVAPDCSVVGQDVVFAKHPLILERTCGGRAVLFARDLTDEQVRSLAETFSITRVVDGGQVYTLGEARSQDLGW